MQKERFCFNYYIDDESPWQPSVFVVLEFETIFDQNSAPLALNANPGRPDWFDATKSFNHRRMREADFRPNSILTEAEANFCAAKLGTSIETAQQLALAKMGEKIGYFPDIVDKSKKIGTVIAKADRRFINDVQFRA